MGFVHGSSSGYSYHKCRCDECVAWKRAWRRLEHERHGDAIRARNRAYHEANRERLNAARAARGQDPEYQRRYRAENRERINAKNRAWRAAHHWRAKAFDVRNYCARSGAPLTTEAYEWIRSLVDPACTYCGERATGVDHWLPISRGGPSSRENLVPCCDSCQRRKNAMSPADWLRKVREAG